MDISPWGVSDMAGNAREWVSDDASNGEKTVRGGSYDFPADQFLISGKASRLPGVDPSHTWPVGVRCAADANVALKLKQ